jgi:hypothetical protein
MLVSTQQRPGTHKETARGDVVPTDIWQYRFETPPGTDIKGFDVEAIDGSIGHIEYSAAEAAAGSSIVVDTGPWIFGKKVMLPAGVVDRIDLEEQKVYVNRTKEEIKNAPEYDDRLVESDEYRTSVAGYYGAGGPGWRDWTLP